MDNLKFTFPTPEGDITQVVSKATAAGIMKQHAKDRGVTYISDQAAIKDFMVVQSATETDLEIGVYKNDLQKLR